MDTVDIEVVVPRDPEGYQRDILEEFDSVSGLNEEMRVVHASAGAALFCAELLEYDLHNIVHAARKVSGEATKPEHHDAIDQELDGKMLGVLLGKVKGILTIDEASLKILDEGRTARNQLCHRFYKRNESDLYNRAGRRRLVEKLTDITVTIREATAISTGIAKALLYRAGYTEEQLSQGLDDLFDE